MTFYFHKYILKLNIFSIITLVEYFAIIIKVKNQIIDIHKVKNDK